KFGKFGATAISMIVSIAAYALVFGWGYAAGFVGLLMVHEMGHWLAARRCGLAAGAPTFIPFVGAWIELKDAVLDPRTEANVA
ncbi:site-2 protease family protein, partial [Klebsiella pneumoniae]